MKKVSLYPMKVNEAEYTGALFRREEGVRILERLSAARHVLILGHKGPDGDSVGSTLAMRAFLTALGTKCTVAMDGTLPSSLRRMDGIEQICSVKAGVMPQGLVENIEEADLICCLDFNGLSRIGKTLEDALRLSLAQRPRTIVCIDHHPEPKTEEFDMLLSIPRASATCHVLAVLMGETLPQLPESIRQSIATQLLWGIITDTGLFNHASSDPDLYEVVAQLLRLGAQKDFIVNESFHSRQPERLRLEGYILEHMVIREDLGAAYFTLSLEELRQFGVHPSDTEGFVNKPLDIEGVRCSAFFRESTDEGIKASMRSKGNFAVNEICKTCYGGGGHRNAAGGELHSGRMEEAVSLFLNEMTRITKEEAHTTTQQ